MGDFSDAAEERDRPPSFFQELKRRRVLRTALWYAGSAVAVVEAADVFAPSLGLPVGSVRVLAIVAVCGAPLSLAIAWAYDVRPDEGATSWWDRPWARHALVLGVAALGLAAALVLWGRGGEASPAGAGAPPLSGVAILPLETFGGDEDLRNFAAHLHGRLIDGLAAAAVPTTDASDARLRVISRAGVLPFGGGSTSIQEIGRTLGVGTIIEGDVAAGSDRMEVRLRLVDAASAERLGTTTVTAELGDRLGLLKALSDSAAVLIRQELGEVVSTRLRLLETESREAYRHLIWAEELEEEFVRAFAAQDLTLASRALREADSLYARAGSLDPEWAEPPLQRGWLSNQRAQLATARGGADLRSVYGSSLAHAEEALARSPGHRRALHLQGTLRYHLATRAGLSPARKTELLAAAEADLRAAVRGNPQAAAPLLRLSQVAAHQGRYDEAVRFGERALQEDPYLEAVEITHLRLFEYSLRLDRDEEARRWCAEGARRFQQPIFQDCQLMLLAWTRLQDPPVPDSAWALLERELAPYPEPLRPRLEPRLLAMVAAVLARAGEADSARAVLARARTMDPGTGGFRTAAAGVYGLLGEADSGLAEVRQYLASAPEQQITLLSAPELRSLRGDPRLRELVRTTAAGG